MAVCKANADFKLKGFTAESVEKDCVDLDKLVADNAAKEQATTPLRNQHDVMADQARPWRKSGVATIRKASLLPADRSMNE